MAREPYVPGSLVDRIREVGRRALRRGALKPIATTPSIVEDGGLGFLVRISASVADKASAAAEQALAAASGRSALNPFLPCDPDLFVTGLTGSHACLLNKFKVIDDHLLIVTRKFEAQERLLDPADFEAMAICLAEIDGLGFYNGGVVAGASQPHKHLQLVPLGRHGRRPALPIAALAEDVADRRPVSLPELPFAHAVIALGPVDFAAAPEAASALRRGYAALLAAIGIGDAGGGCQSAPYNLLLTRRWMLAVPRRAEAFESIAINALGFAGSLFVRDRAQMDIVRRIGPMAILAQVAGLPR